MSEQSLFEHLTTADRLATRDRVLAMGAPVPLRCGLVVAGAWVVGHVVGEAPPDGHGNVPVHFTAGEPLPPHRRLLRFTPCPEGRLDEDFAEAVERSRLRDERRDVDGRWLAHPWAAIHRAIRRQILMDQRRREDIAGLRARFERGGEVEELREIALRQELERLDYWHHIEPQGLVSLKDTEEVRRLGQALARRAAGVALARACGR